MLIQNCLKRRFSLHKVKVRECLVPRKEIEAIDLNTSIEEVRRKFVDTRLSKLVVYDGNIDHIVGYIHQLDLFKKPAIDKRYFVAHSGDSGKYECHGPDQ